MPKAIWQETLLAESDKTIVIEGNHYFPPQDVKWEYLQGCGTRRQSTWKGQAVCFDIVIGHEINEGAAWSYPDPQPPAENLRDYVAFWKGVEIVLEPEPVPVYARTRNRRR
jgi:uncharacterized protein (DUF427 family)